MEEARTQDELHLSLASSRIDGARSSPEQDRATSSGIGFIRRRGQFQLEQGPFGIVARTEKVQEKLKMNVTRRRTQIDARSRHAIRKSVDLGPNPRWGGLFLPNSDSLSLSISRFHL